MLRLTSLSGPAVAVLLVSFAIAQDQSAPPVPPPPAVPDAPAAPVAPAAGAAAAAACTPPVAGAAAPAGTPPTLDAISPGFWVTGTAAKSAQIVICVDGKEATITGTGTADPDGKFEVQLKTALTADQKVTVQEKTAGKAGAADTYGPLSTAVTVGASNVSFDFGRVRIYLSAGAILSQDQGQFSKASTYLDFTVDNTWFLGNHDHSKDKTPTGGHQGKRVV